MGVELNIKIVEQSMKQYDSAQPGNEPLWQTILGCLVLVGLWAVALIIL